MRFKLAFLLTGLTLALKNDAQVITLDKSDYRQVLKFDVGAAIDRDLFSLAFEQVVSEKSSLQVTAGIFQYDWEYEVPTGLQFHTLTGWMLRPEYRRYLPEFVNEKAPHIAFVSGFVMLDRSERFFRGGPSQVPRLPNYLGNGDWYNLKSTEQFWGLGVSVGGQFFFPRGVGLEFAVDGMLGYESWNQTGEELAEGIIRPYFRKQIGVIGRTQFRISVLYGFAKN